MKEQDFSFYKGKNILITGGLGFIGSNLCHKLVDLNANITVVDSLIPEYGGNLFNVEDIKEKIHINIADIRDQYTMNNLVQEKDIIFNLAGQVSHIDSMNNPFPDADINARSQLYILEACRRFNPNAKVLFAGSRSQYGRALHLPVDEKHPLKPTDFNGINKITGERYHLLYNDYFGIKTCSLRISNTFGPRQFMKNARQTFLAWFIRLAVEGKEITIYGDGKQKRDFCYVDDVVNAFLLAGQSDKSNGQYFNVGNGIPVSVSEIAEKVVEAAGSGKLSFTDWPEDKKKIEIGDYYTNHEKITKALGWSPETSIEEGLKKTIEYVKKYKEHYF